MKPPTSDERLSDNDPNGCLRCCVAAVLEVPLAQVPKFVLDDHPADDKIMWVDALSAYLSELGLCQMMVLMPDRRDNDDQFPFVAAGAVHVRIGSTPLGVSHAVVYRGDEFVYDSLGNDESAFLPDADGNYAAMLLVPLDPTQIQMKVRSEVEVG